MLRLRTRLRTAWNLQRPLRRGPPSTACNPLTHGQLAPPRVRLNTVSGYEKAAMHLRPGPALTTEPVARGAAPGSPPPEAHSPFQAGAKPPKHTSTEEDVSPKRYYKASRNGSVPT